MACGHKAKDITTSIAWMRESWEEETLDIFLERTREGHRHSDGAVSKAMLGKLIDGWGAYGPF